MPTQDGSDPAYHMPFAFAGQDEEQDIGNAYEGAVTSPRFFKASILIAIATVAGIAALFIADPVALVSNVAGTLVGNSAPQPVVEPPTPPVQSAADAPALTQSVADAQDLAPPATDAPKSESKNDSKSDLKSDEAAASEPAESQDQTQTSQDQMQTSRDQTVKSEPSPDALFRQFQAWAADQEAQANATPAQPVQDTPAKVVPDAPAQPVEQAQAPHRLAPRHRPIRTAHSNARAEMPAQNIRRVRREQRARAERPPVRDARAQEQPAQNSQNPPVQNNQAPSFLSGLGLRN